MLHWHHYIKILCIIYLYVIYFVYAISKWCTITFLFCLPATAPATVVFFFSKSVCNLRSRIYATYAVPCTQKPKFPVQLLPMCRGDELSAVIFWLISKCL